MPRLALGVAARIGGSAGRVVVGIGLVALPFLAGLFVMGCAPAFPPRPELPPVSAAIGNPEASERSAPVIPKPAAEFSPLAITKSMA